MPINSRCLRKLTEIGLPMEVEVIDKSGNKIAVATINMDGTVSCGNGKTYGSPSLLRDDLIGSSLPTYPYLIYKGKTLKDWGVSPTDGTY